MEEGWSVRFAAPDPRLAGVVRRYQRFWESAPTRAPRLQAATTKIPLILLLDRGMSVDGRRVGSFAVGPHDAPSVTEHPGAQLGIEVELTLPGARLVHGMPLVELAGGTTPFDDVHGRAASQLVERLREADWPGQVALLDAFLLRRVATARALRPEVAEAWAVLQAGGGDVRVEALAARTGFSRRHLTQQVHTELGLGPKVLARVLRFERACRLVAGEGVTLAAAAHTCGYADQPHLNRDFRQFAGTSPGAWVAQLPFVQDSGAAPT